MSEVHVNDPKRHESKWRGHSVVIALFAVTGIVLLWLLSEGKISQGIAIWTIPVCFLAVATTVTLGAVKSLRR